MKGDGCIANAIWVDGESEHPQSVTVLIALFPTSSLFISFVLPYFVRHSSLWLNKNERHIVELADHRLSLQLLLVQRASLLAQLP